MCGKTTYPSTEDMADDLLSLQYDQREFPVESVLKEIVKSAMVTALHGPGLSKALEVTCPYARYSSLL